MWNFWFIWASTTYNWTYSHKQNPHQVDLIFTYYADRVVCSGVSHIAISDHSLIYVYRKLSPAFPSKGHSTISYGNFKNSNRESFRNDIAQQDWTCNGSDDPNVLWADWKTKFLDVVNFHAPLRTRRARIKKAPWINSELKKGMRDRHAAKRMIHANGQSTKSCEIQ